jgi:ribosome maturation factor RimP
MTIQERVHSLARPLAESLGLDVVEIEWTREHGRRILRVTIDKPEGISHADCEALSRQIDKELDGAEGLIEAYHLEVSSPGAERSLKTDADFRRFAGRRVLIKLREPVGGRTEWRGLLCESDPERVVVEQADTRVALPRAVIASARLSID